MLVDSHCHLDRLDLAPYGGSLDKALDAARSVGVEKFLCIGIGRCNAQQVIDIAVKNADIYATVGLHPLEFSVSDYNPERETLGAEAIKEWLFQQAKHPKVIGIGETGLDYYYSKEDKEQQQASFIAHLQVAKALKKPVVVHTRDARTDTISLIKAYGSGESVGVLHCFTESWEMAKQALDLGYYISFSGIISFKNALNLREVAAKIPKNRLLIETDSPYLAPVPYRGKKNEPKYVLDVARCLAELRGVAVEEVSEITRVNFNTLFGV